ncbi:MAG: ABC transporter permease subunit [Dehalococcoidia bacterium]
MQGYILRRVMLAIPTIIGITMVVFGMMRFIPGDVVDVIFGDYGTNPELKEKILNDLGLDEPWPVQYVRYIGQLGRGDLGHSIISGRSVNQELKARIPVTLQMGLMAMVFSLIVALPIGVLSAIRQDTIFDYLGRTFAIGLIAIPNFFFAIMLLIILAREFNWVPPPRYVGITKDPVENLQIMILPSLVLGAALSGSVMRFTRTQMLEVMRQDYIRTAQAKGLRERTIIIRHAIRNSFIPVITVVGIQIPVILGGTLIIESIFNIPGVGRYLVASIAQKDYPVVQSVNLILAVFIVVLNIVVDVTYGVLDPRIRYR